MQSSNSVVNSNVALGPLFSSPHTKAEFKTSRALKPLPICLDAIPPELKHWLCWVGWTDLPWRHGEKGKTPQFFGAPEYYVPDAHEEDILYVRRAEFGIYNARPNDPATWMSFDGVIELFLSDIGRAYRNRRAYYGLGFMLLNTPFVGIDLDGCRNPATGELESWALKIVHALGSYVEASPSGTGVKILVRGHLPGEFHKTSDGQVEVYGSDTGRYFAITGHVILGYDKILECQAELNTVYEAIFADKIEAAKKRSTVRTGVSSSPSSPSVCPRPVDLRDHEIINKACHAKNGPCFEALWNGIVDGYPSRSEADFALATSLAFWCAGDAVRVESLMRQSGLWRPKWDKGGYLSRTVGNAVRTCTSFYGQGAWDHEFDDIKELIDAGVSIKATASKQVQAAVVILGATLAVPLTIKEEFGKELTAAQIERRDADRAAQAATEACSAASYAAHRGTNAARHRQFSHLPRGRHCGCRHIIADPERGDGWLGWLRCGRNNGCDYCRAWNFELWREKLTSHLSPLPAVYVWQGPIERDEDGGPTVRNIIDRLRRVGANFARIQQPNDEAIVFADAPFTGGEEVATPNAIIQLRTATDCIPNPCDPRPFSTSRAWKLERRKKSRFKDYGPVNGGSKELADIVNAAGGIVEAERREEPSLKTGLERRSFFRLPRRFASDECLQNLAMWMNREDVPLDGNLWKNPEDEECDANWRAHSSKKYGDNFKTNARAGTDDDLNKPEWAHDFDDL